MSTAHERHRQKVQRPGKVEAREIIPVQESDIKNAREKRLTVTEVKTHEATIPIEFSHFLGIWKHGSKLVWEAGYDFFNNGEPIVTVRRVKEWE